MGLIPRRLARATRAGVSPREARQSARPAARHSQSQAARARSCGSAAERAGAVGSHRPQAATVAAPRRATLAAAARSHRPGGASRDRPVVIADERGSSTGAILRAGGHCARRDHARRGRAYRRAGGGPAARGPAPRTTGAPAGARNRSGSDPARIGSLLPLAYSAAPRWWCGNPYSWLVMNSRSRLMSPPCSGCFLNRAPTGCRKGPDRRALTLPGCGQARPVRYLPAWCVRRCRRAGFA